MKDKKRKKEYDRNVFLTSSERELEIKIINHMVDIVFSWRLKQISMKFIGKQTNWKFSINERSNNTNVLKSREREKKIKIMNENGWHDFDSTIESKFERNVYSKK